MKNRAVLLTVSYPNSKKNKSVEGNRMSAKLIDGIAIGKELREEIKEGVGILEASGCKPGLSVILVGEDPASQTYVKNKEKSSIEVGMKSELIRLPATVTEEELLSHVDRLNNDESIHG